MADSRPAKKRRYRSALREEQVEATRARILDAAVAVLAEDLTGLTMPAVAKAAGVSLPTVYRHYPDKRALLDAAVQRMRARLGVISDDYEGLEGLCARQARIMGRFEKLGDDYRALLAVSNAQTMPPEELEPRMAILRERIADDLDGLDGPDAERVLELANLLCSSVGGLAMTRFGLHGDEAAGFTAWTLETLVAGLRARKRSR